MASQATVTTRRRARLVHRRDSLGAAHRSAEDGSKRGGGGCLTGSPTREDAAQPASSGREAPQGVARPVVADLAFVEGVAELGEAVLEEVLGRDVERCGE